MFAIIKSAKFTICNDDMHIAGRLSGGTYRLCNVNGGWDQVITEY